MANKHKNIEELLYYKALVDSATMRYRLLAECCRLQRNLEQAFRSDYQSEEEFMDFEYEYPIETQDR